MAEGDKGAYFIGTSNVVLTGSINVTGANTDVPGTGTAYLSELGEGVDITVSTETRTIASVTNDTTATVTSPWGSDLADDLTPEVACQYATITAAEAATAATLVGNLTFLHKDEETNISTIVTFNADTDTYLLKLTAAAGAEHNGGAYGNGARINYDAGDRIKVTGVSMDQFELSNLAINCAGSGNAGIQFEDGADTGLFDVNRVIFEGDSSTAYGIKWETFAVNGIFRNNIIYGGMGSGIDLDRNNTGSTLEVYNNTVVKNVDNIVQNHATIAGTLTVKNNLCQGGTSNDYRNDGAGWGTSNQNIDEDGGAGTPPTNHYTVNAHDATSSFTNYDANDFRLTGSGTDDGTLDNGENLFSDVPVDITGTARVDGTPFWIGASHVVAAVGRTTKNTDAYPLGVNVGMSWRMPSNYL